MLTGVEDAAVTCSSFLAATRCCGAAWAELPSSSTRSTAVSALDLGQGRCLLLPLPLLPLPIKYHIAQSKAVYRSKTTGRC